MLHFERKREKAREEAQTSDRRRDEEVSAIWCSLRFSEHEMADDFSEEGFLWFH